MGQLADLRLVDPVLTTIARGYSNAEFIGDKLFPFVTVDKEGGRIPKFGKESFRVYDTERAIRADSNQMQAWGIETITYETTEHDLKYPIDYRELKESALDLKTRATESTTEAIRLKHEKICAELAQDDNLYPASNKEIITTDKFNLPNTDPIKIIEEKKSALRSIIGKRPNTMVMGASVFDALKNHPKIIERIKYSQVGVITLDLLKAVFGIPNIFVGESVFSDDGINFSDIWADNVILAYVTNPSGMASTPYEPCFGYTLRVRGFPFVDTWEENGGKITVVRTTDNFDVKIVGIESAFLIKDVL